MESLLEEIFNNCLFPKLEYSDLLRLRRVCKFTKTFADEFLRNNFQDKVREIDEYNDLDFFMKLFFGFDLPLSSIYINNSSSFSFVFEDWYISTFLHFYGDKITHLRLHNFEAFEPEINFFSGLPNLQHLELDRVTFLQTDSSCDSQNIDGADVGRENPPFPPIFKTLKTLKLDSIEVSKPDDYGYVWDMLEFCENLEYFKHVHTNPVSTHPDGLFGHVMDYIRQRSNSNLPNLRYYDLENVRYRTQHYTSQQFCNLVRLCYEHQVKLLNVPAQFLKNAPIVFRDSPEQFTTPLVSMDGVRTATFFAELPNMEKLVIEGMGASTFVQPSWPTEILREPPRWPSLKSLDLKISKSGMVHEDADYSEFMVNFLFGAGNRREGLRELAIRHSTSYCNDHDPGFLVPNPRDITESCPNLTKLTLEGWIGTDEQVTMFWKGLPLLEEVTLEYCHELGDAAFIGETGNENPVFLQLKNLKKLSLVGIHAMPRITDLSFRLVFSRLKIKEFYLISHRTFDSISMAGIESLVTGDFNMTVEKFPFDWGLVGVSDEEFTQLKLKFRASHML